MCKPKVEPSKEIDWSNIERNIVGGIDRIQGGAVQQRFLNFAPIRQGHQESAREWLDRTRGESVDILVYLDDWVLLERGNN